MSSFSLAGKVAIVTGGQRGIGLGIVKELATAGAHVLLTGIMQEAGEHAAQELRKKGLSVQFRHLSSKTK